MQKGRSSDSQITCWVFSQIFFPCRSFLAGTRAGGWPRVQGWRWTRIKVPPKIPCTGASRALHFSWYNSCKSRISAAGITAPYSPETGQENTAYRSQPWKPPPLSDDLHDTLLSASAANYFCAAYSINQISPRALNENEHQRQFKYRHTF